MARIRHVLPVRYEKPGAGYVCSATHKLVVVNQSVCEKHYLPVCVCVCVRGESVVHSVPSCRGVVTVPVHAVLFPQGDQCSGVVLCQSPEQTNIKPSLPETESGHNA